MYEVGLSKNAPYCNIAKNNWTRHTTTHWFLGTGFKSPFGLMGWVLVNQKKVHMAWMNKSGLVGTQPPYLSYHKLTI